MRCGGAVRESVAMDVPDARTISVLVADDDSDQRVLLERILAGALALFFAACGGGSSRDDEARAVLRADSAFSTPVTIRIPRSIRVTATMANSGSNGFSGVARFGPEHFHQLNAPMSVLSAAAFVAFSIRSTAATIEPSLSSSRTVPPSR